MNIKRFIGAAVVVFISFQLFDYLIHNLMLGPTYQKLISVWRPDMMDKMWIMHLTSLFLSFLFVYIFTKGYEGKGVGEGVRYGLLIGLLMNGVGAFNQYVIYPVPFKLAVQWFIFGTLEFIIAGIITALIYRPEE